jgi:hypothetical protein
MTSITAPGNQQPQTNNVQITHSSQKGNFKKKISQLNNDIYNSSSHKQKFRLICLFLLVLHGRNIILKEIFFG